MWVYFRTYRCWKE